MGGHADKNLFAGTHGSRRFESSPARAGELVESRPIQNPQPASSLKEHIEDFDGVARDGIKGCHKKCNFEEAVDSLGGRIEGTEPLESIDGVEQVTYRLPKKDKTGKPTSEMRAQTFKKTVYDSSVISTEEYVSRGLEAAADAARKSTSGMIGHEWTGTDSHGVSWHGYTDADGSVTSFYPIDE